MMQGEAQRYDLAFSVKRQNATRMANDVVQADNTFRGLKSLTVIPFKTEEAAPVSVSNYPMLSIATGTEANRVTGQDYYYIGRCQLTQGTNRVLVYGQAQPLSGKTAPAQNGVLETSVGTTDIVPADISFSLTSIRNTTDVHTDAQALANYLTAIANTDGWSTTGDAALKALYLDFINARSDGTGLMAGSAAHLKAYVKALREELEGNPGLVSTAIITNIDADAKSCLDNGYPSGSESLGLPDGAAGFGHVRR